MREETLPIRKSRCICEHTQNLIVVHHQPVLSTHYWLLSLIYNADLVISLCGSSFSSQNAVTPQSMRTSTHPHSTVRVVPASSSLVRGTAHLQTTHLLRMWQRKRGGEGDHRHLLLLLLPPVAALEWLQENLQEIA